LLASAYNVHAKTIDRVYAYDDVYRLTGETVNGTATAGAASYGHFHDSPPPWDQAP
jgi:hypothetical protein